MCIRDRAEFEWTDGADGGTRRVRAVDTQSKAVLIDITVPMPAPEPSPDEAQQSSSKEKKPSPWMPFAQTPTCFSVKQIGASRGAFNASDKHSIFLSRPEQSFSMAIMAGAKVSVPPSSPFHAVFSGTEQRDSPAVTTLILRDATFIMSEPTLLASVP